MRDNASFTTEDGPRRGLFLGGGSSIAPGVPWENLKILTEGFNYYRTHGRPG